MQKTFEMIHILQESKSEHLSNIALGKLRLFLP